MIDAFGVRILAFNYERPKSTRLYGEFPTRVHLDTGSK
jgi:hypothetical protein